MIINRKEGNAVGAQTDAYGYDGSAYTVGSRVELHPGTDLWMQGARFGVVTGMSLTPRDRVKVRLDKVPGRTFSGSAATFRCVEYRPIGGES
jgi:hypothetical protein